MRTISRHVSLNAESITAVDGIDFSLEGVKLYRNGVFEASGIGAAVLEHPARAVAWLVNTLADLDEQLPAGQSVSLLALDLHHAVRTRVRQERH